MQLPMEYCMWTLFLERLPISIPGEPPGPLTGRLTYAFLLLDEDARRVLELAESSEGSLFDRVRAEAVIRMMRNVDAGGAV